MSQAILKQMGVGLLTYFFAPFTNHAGHLTNATHVILCGIDCLLD